MSSSVWITTKKDHDQDEDKDQGGEAPGQSDSPRAVGWRGSGAVTGANR